MGGAQAIVQLVCADKNAQTILGVPEPRDWLAAVDSRGVLGKREVDKSEKDC